MHTANYPRALEVLVHVQKDDNYETLPPAIKEIWKIFEAYLNYLILIGILDATDTEAQKKEFRINRFLNEVEVFAKDKRGMNISVLILQFLYALAQGNYELCETRTDALSKYRIRYLKGKATLRSNHFIALLLKIPACNFDLELVKAKTLKAKQWLTEHPWEEVNQSREVEVIPYEHLWEMALKSLSTPSNTPP
ncbi:MAG: hypothetical protein IPK76_03760 [Lewinellaceae bacterium]|nr:hypothetical protein [Lewinellaceae bacterium]